MILKTTSPGRKIRCRNKMLKCVAQVGTRTVVRPSRPGWAVKQMSFITRARSLNEQDLQRNLRFFKVPQASIESIRSKLAFKIFDEYANILKACTV